MGLFGFFKKKSVQPSIQKATFQQIEKYAAYLIQAIHFQQNDNYAPIAAYENNQGELTGFLYIVEDIELSLSTTEAIKRMTALFETRFQDKSIQSYAIFYHAQGNHVVAEQTSDFKALSIQFQTIGTSKVFAELPYQLEGSEISYFPFEDFTDEQNHILFDTKLKPNQEYFQERVTIEPEIIENQAGIKIKKSYNGNLNYTWGALLGFDFFRTETGEQLFMEYSALASMQPSVGKKGITCHQLSFGDVKIVAVKVQKQLKTVYPMIQTRNVLSVETNEINEWANVEQLEAVIAGTGRDTFGVTYFATDYALNRDKYLSTKKLNIELSAICYTLDIAGEKSFNGHPDASNDFTAYLPNKDLVSIGCYDFIGVLKTFKAVSIFDNRVQGYILTVELLKNPNIKDFFILEMFVNQDNMKFEGLFMGMKLTGLFQLQGKIASLNR
jgi:hypothetical protein